MHAQCASIILPTFAAIMFRLFAGHGSSGPQGGKGSGKAPSCKDGCAGESIPPRCCETFAPGRRKRGTRGVSVCVRRGFHTLLVGRSSAQGAHTWLARLPRAADSRDYSDKLRFVVLLVFVCRHEAEKRAAAEQRRLQREYREALKAQRMAAAAERRASEAAAEAQQVLADEDAAKKAAAEARVRPDR